MTKCKICDGNLGDIGSIQCGMIHDEFQQKRLKYLRKQINKECISYDEIGELQSYKKYITDDPILAEWAGIPESEFNNLK